MYLVTGGAGFIGSALVHALVRQSAPLVNVDMLTYAANPASLAEVSGAPEYHFERVDICEADAVRDIFERYRPDAVLHLAAESHVDRSIDAPADFVRTNVVGTFTLLVEARRHWESLPDERARHFRFIHVSTDEVFGSLGATGHFNERSPYDPTSPYSAISTTLARFGSLSDAVHAESGARMRNVTPSITMTSPGRARRQRIPSRRARSSDARYDAADPGNPASM